MDVSRLCACGLVVPLSALLGTALSSSPSWAASANTVSCVSDIAKAADMNHAAILKDTQRPHPNTAAAAAADQVTLNLLGKAEIDCIGQPLAVMGNLTEAAGGATAALTANKLNDPRTARNAELSAAGQMHIAATEAAKSADVFPLSAPAEEGLL